MSLGDHLVTSRGLYTHHGIAVEGGRVIHYSGLGAGMATGPVIESSFDEFANGHIVTVRRSPRRAHGSKATVKRARTRLGEDAYSVTGNNCEQFVNWCIYGRHESRQVDRAVTLSGAGKTVAAGAGAVTMVGTAGTVGGLSGPGVMTGLVAIGPGGAIGGAATLAGGAGLGAAALMNSTVLADDESLDNKERNARAAGRAATIVGAGTATAGGVAAIAGSGAVAGLSGAGITSGLAAIGAGTGAAALTGASASVMGVAVVAAAPVAAAVGLGFGVYKMAQWWSDDD
jgi:hypothetical protein